MTAFKQRPEGRERASQPRGEGHARSQGQQVQRSWGGNMRWMHRNNRGPGWPQTRGASMSQVVGTLAFIPNEMEGSELK